MPYRSAAGFALLAVASCVALGCSRKAPSGSGASASSVTVTAAAVPLPHVDIPMTKNAGPLAGRLQEEAAHRPAGTPTAEAVFGTVEVKGVALHDIVQVPGSALGAAYCAQAETDRNIFLSVCEYTDPSAAAAGKAGSEKVFGAIPRQLVLNKGSLLTLRDDAKTPESGEQMKMLASTFASL